MTHTKEAQISQNRNGLMQSIDYPFGINFGCAYREHRAKPPTAGAGTRRARFEPSVTDVQNISVSFTLHNGTIS